MCCRDEKKPQFLFDGSHAEDMLVLHFDFEMTKADVACIAELPGVAEFKLTTRYSAVLVKGKLFAIEEIQEAILEMYFGEEVTTLPAILAIKDEADRPSHLDEATAEEHPDDGMFPGVNASGGTDAVDLAPGGIQV